MNIFETTTIKEVKLEISELVKLSRKQRRLNQEELASMLNLSRITISNLEQGSNVTLDTLLKVFLYFDLLDSFHEYVATLVRSNKQASLY